MNYAKTLVHSTSLRVWQKRFAFLCATVGISSLIFSGATNIIFSVVAFTILWLSSLAPENLFERESYQRIITFSMIAFFLAQISRVVGGAAWFGVITELAVALQLSRMLLAKKARQYDQILILSFVHIVAASAFTSDLSYGVLFFVYLFSVPIFLTLTHFTRIQEEFSDDKIETSEVVSTSFVSKLLLFSFPLLLMTGAFFVVFPRVGAGFVPFGRTSARAKTGFSDSVQLGGIGRIQEDQSIVLRVFDWPKKERLLMRGISFDHYEKGRWERSDKVGEQIATDDEGQFVIRGASRIGDFQNHRVQLEALDETVIFYSPKTTLLRFPSLHSGVRFKKRRLEQSSGGTIHYRDSLGNRQDYEIVRVTKTTKEIGFLTEQRKSDYLQVPNNIKKELESYLSEIAEPSQTDTKKVNAVLDHLHSNKFSYTLDQEATDELDPVIAFLTSTKRGHCEYFSSAMVLLVRTSGIPARSVAGYADGYENVYGDYRALREKDAHSWVEVFLNGRWQTFDPTPAASLLVSKKGTNTFSGVRDIVDALRSAWGKGVVSFGAREQVGALMGAFSALKKFRSWFQSENKPKSEVKSVSTKVGIPPQVLWIFMGLFLLVATVIIRRGFSSRKNMGALIDRFVLHCESKLNLSPSKNRTLVELSRRLEASSFSSESEMLGRYLSWRFGGFDTEQNIRREIGAFLKK